MMVDPVAVDRCESLDHAFGVAHHLADLVNESDVVHLFLGSQAPRRPGTGALRDVGNGGFTRLTICDRSHTLPRHVAGEAEYERLQAPCPRDFQLLAATHV